jgi:serine/threonine-protein kinase
MELVDGPTVEDRISQGTLQTDEALRIASQIVDGLMAAHEIGIVHRDLKPSNIKLRPDGTVKLLDFGIAKTLDARAVTGPGQAALATPPAMTEAGMVLGSAPYMSPEQARGRPVDHRTDIWAFGCVLYEMLTGQAAFLGEDATTTLARVLQASPDFRSLPPDTPVSVRRTLELCLVKDARERIADMRDVKLGLAGAFAPAAPTPLQPRWRRALPIAAALLIGALLASAFFLASPRQGEPAQVAAVPLVSRFEFVPPATAPLANQPSIDLAISADGSLLAYLAVKPENGNLEIMVRELDELEVRPIPGTEAPDVGIWNPFFSPDAMSIGYAAPGRGLVSAPLDGGPQIRIAEPPNAFFGGWWAGDNTIIYSTPETLNRVSATGGGTPTPLMDERETGVVGAPALLPGGRALLFHEVGAAGGRHVAVLDLDTGVEETLIEGGSYPHYVDTGHLVFFRDDTLSAVPFDVTDLRVTGEEVPLAQGIREVSGGTPDFALSASGTLVYVPDAPEVATARSIIWVDPATGMTRQAVPELIPGARAPRLSHDDTRLLLVTGPNDDGDLWSYDLQGRPASPLELSGDVSAPVWNPDSSQVAFHTQPLNAAMILRVDAGEVAPRTLSTDLYVVPQAWSTVGEVIATGFGARADIVAIPVSATGAARVIIASEDRAFDPAISPNDRWLAFVSNRSGQDEVWVQQYPDGVPKRVTSGGGYEPLWSRSGQELFYRQADTVMAVDVDTGDEFSFGSPRPLFSGPYLRGGDARSYDVASNGQFLMILAADENRAVAPATIVVVQNFGEELKRRVRPRAQ